MPIDHKNFKGVYFKRSIPAWKCPFCKGGVLEFEDKDIQVIESTQSLKEHNAEEWDFNFVLGGFIGKLTCENSQCEEVVVFAGKMGADVDYVFNIETEEHQHEIIDRLIPQYFNPPLNIFALNENLPSKLQSIILEAFGLFWYNTSSCANKIRTAVEFILDQKKVQKFRPRGKRIPITLHQRIISFRVKNPEAADLFEAIKFIGNAGSHSVDKVKKTDLLSAFEILERSMEIVYDNHPKKIASLARKIIKSRGPIKAKKSKRRGLMASRLHD
jgi:hypothetical protein